MPRRPLLDETPTHDFGPYRLAHRIAVGGMAEVYRALWPQAAGGDRAVVIKRMLPSLLDDAEQRAMFEHEARLGARIDHPNVVAMLDHGTDGEVPYLVLEYVFGVDLWRLSRWMRRVGQTFRVPLAVWIAHQMLAGLAAVHDVRDDTGAPLHVVHRDVSPSNLFLSVHGDVKLGDLGIARALLQERTRRAVPGFRAKGKLGYLPPEQVSGGDVDQRGDVFAAAVVLAELLMGRPLFAGETEIGVLLAIRDGDLSPFQAVMPRLPEGLGRIVLRALERRPELRTPTAAALRDELTPFTSEESSSKLRNELGQLVVGALDDDDAKDHTSLAATIEKDAAWFEIPTPVLPPGQRPPGPRADSELRYRVERSGELLGRFTLAELVRSLTTHEVLPTDTVRIGNGSAQPVSGVPELSRHLPLSMRTPTVRRRTQMAETNELYDLSSRSALAVLVAACLARDEGLLLFSRGEVRKEVYVQRGVPSYVTSNQPAELLGETLVARGVIAREELEMALSAMPRFEGRLGQTLLALELVDPVVLFGHMAEQVQEKVLELFVWRDGHAALYRGIDPPERAFPMQADPWELFQCGAERRVAAGLEHQRFDGRDGETLVRTGDLRVVPGSPSASVKAIWSACEEPKELASLLTLAADPVSGRAAILVLVELGMLHWEHDRVL